jgi:hypothetical protein
MSKKKRRSTQPGRGPQQEQPQWQPVSMLPTLAQAIDGMLQADLEQYINLQQAKDKPHVLDDFTVNRVITVFTEQSSNFWIYDEQLRRWQQDTLTPGQRDEVERLVEQMRRLRENNTNVLLLARELSKRTIEKVLAKSDVELGLEMLMKGLPTELRD